MRQKLLTRVPLALIQTVLPCWFLKSQIHPLSPHLSSRKIHKKPRKGSHNLHKPFPDNLFSTLLHRRHLNVFSTFSRKFFKKYTSKKCSTSNFGFIFRSFNQTNKYSLDRIDLFQLFVHKLIGIQEFRGTQDKCSDNFSTNLEVDH